MRQKTTRIYLLSLPLLLLLSMVTEAQRINTRINIDKRSEQDISDNLIKVTLDKQTGDSLLVKEFKFFSFDKPVSSLRESFFITNASDIDIAGIELEIEYFTTDSLSLHKRIVSIECQVPSGETRKIDIKSWDSQKSFYYFQSVKPRRQATPFKVRFNLISYYLKELNNKK